MRVPAFNDDLDDLDSVPSKSAVQPAAAVAAAAASPASAVAAAPVAAAATTSQASAPVPSAPVVGSNELEDVAPTRPPERRVGAGNQDIDWGDDDTLKDRGYLERLRPPKGYKARFAFLPWAKLVKNHTHYVVGKGTFICLSSDSGRAICCELTKEEPRLTIVGLVLHYTNADPLTGAYKKGSNGDLPAIKWDIKFVNLSLTNFKNISSIVETMDGGNISDIDFIMQHKSDNERAKGYDFVQTRSQHALWKQYPDVVQGVKAAVKKLRDPQTGRFPKLDSRIGRLLTEKEIQGLLTSNNIATTASLDDLDAII